MDSCKPVPNLFCRYCSGNTEYLERRKGEDGKVVQGWDWVVGRQFGLEIDRIFGRRLGKSRSGRDSLLIIQRYRP